MAYKKHIAAIPTFPREKLMKPTNSRNTIRPAIVYKNPKLMAINRAIDFEI